jgi:methionine synthase II (cobalamin-independent)
MPHLDPGEACSLVLEHLPQIPAWPQLPKRSFQENMYVQFSEGFPGIVIQDERIYVDRSLNLEQSLEQLYAAYLENNTEQFAISADCAAGFYAFLATKMEHPLTVKGQITGPISLGLVLTDEERRAVIYDDILADALAKHLRLKAAWQESMLSNICPNTIIFVDEPYFASLGSAFISLPMERAIMLLEEVLQGIKGLKGIHCCGNTDWAALLNTSIDILSFDAYNYGGVLSLYSADVKRFLEQGGIIAWGIVPTMEEALTQETVPNLLERLKEMIAALCQKGIDYDMLREQCLITPSCGLGSLSPKGAERALKLVTEVSREFRKGV